MSPFDRWAGDPGGSNARRSPARSHGAAVSGGLSLVLTCGRRRLLAYGTTEGPYPTHALQPMSASPGSPKLRGSSRCLRRSGTEFKRPPSVFSMGKRRGGQLSKPPGARPDAAVRLCEASQVARPLKRAHSPAGADTGHGTQCLTTSQVKQGQPVSWAQVNRGL